MKSFEISAEALSLIPDALKSLINKRPLPLRVDKQGRKIGAKGWEYDWTTAHDNVFDKIVEDRVGMPKPYYISQS